MPGPNFRAGRCTMIIGAGFSYYVIVLGPGILTIPDFKRIICIRAEHKWVPTTKAIYGEHLHASVICDLVPLQGIPSILFPAMIRATNPSIASPEHTFIENASTARSGPRLFGCTFCGTEYTEYYSGTCQDWLCISKPMWSPPVSNLAWRPRQPPRRPPRRAARVSDESGQSMGH